MEWQERCRARSETVRHPCKLAVKMTDLQREAEETARCVSTSALVMVSTSLFYLFIHKSSGGVWESLTNTRN